MYTITLRRVDTPAIFDVILFIFRKRDCWWLNYRPFHKSELAKKDFTPCKRKKYPFWLESLHERKQLYIQQEHYLSWTCAHFPTQQSTYFFVFHMACGFQVSVYNSIFSQMNRMTSMILWALNYLISNQRGYWGMKTFAPSSLCSLWLQMNSDTKKALRSSGKRRGSLRYCFNEFITPK